MKRLLIILLCLPLIFACKREEPFVEGEEIVLDMSVITDDVQSIATRAMGDNVIGGPVLWLVVFDGEGMLVEWTKAKIGNSGVEDGDTTKVVVTSFTASLHATSDKRIIHFLLNYVGDGEDLGLTFGHENNVIGALTVGPDHGVYWQRVELPDGINSTNTASNYLNKVPLLRNFSKITVSVDATTCQGFSLSDFYVLNVPKYGTVAPFQNGNFIDYCIYDDTYTERPPFDGRHFDAKDYETLDVDEGYRGTMPNNSERINKASEFVEPTEDPESPKTSYFLYENTYVSGDNTRAVFVLLKGTYKGTEYWYRVDLVKQNTSTSMMEYFDILRNFSYNITIKNITEGKKTAQEAINNPAGNNVLSSLDIAHLTEISDGHALLEVNHTDTVLISRDEVYVRYKFTDTGAPSVNNGSIKANNGNGYGWYLTYKGETYNGNNNKLPINVEFEDEDEDETEGQYAGWRTITISVAPAALIEREVVSLTLFAKSSNGPMLSRTVDYTLLPKQKMLVECPAKVPTIVGSPVNVSILIPDRLPEAMFPLDFAIEAQGTNQSGTEKNYLAQHISPHKNEVMTVKTAGSIVDNDALRGKKSFQYMVTFSYEDYLAADSTTRQLEAGGQDVPVRVFTKKFVTNTAESASRVYAYNKYFDLGKDNFINLKLTMSKGYKYYGSDKSFSVSGDDANSITVKENGKTLIENNNSFTTETFASPIELVYKDSEEDISFVYEREILVCNKFAINGTGLNDNTNIIIEYATKSKQGAVSATKKQLADGGLELVIPGLTKLDETISIVLSYTYTTTGRNPREYTYKSNTINITVGNLMNAQISGINFTRQQ